MNRKQLLLLKDVTKSEQCAEHRVQCARMLELREVFSFAQMIRK